MLMTSINLGCIASLTIAYRDPLRHVDTY